VFRCRWLACCLFLAAIPFTTAPGDIIADTKFELVVNPSGFLSSALTLWDPQQFGGLLNQAVGYLFPMGPFFKVLRLLPVEGWIVQRLWIGVLLIAAFAGTVRLAGRMGIGTQGTRAAAGLAYAMSPVALSIVGHMSGEFLPMAMLPWILIPLADMHPWQDSTEAAGREGPAARARAVARSAAAVALCSGMNAASAVAVLVPVLIFIVTRRGARPKIRMLAWWLPAVVLVTFSWSVPLLLLSRYGVSVVPYTESAQVTSSATSLLNIFRGTEIWVSYLVVNGSPWWPLAYQICTEVLPALVTGLLAALGLAGLVHRKIPERRFLLWCVLGGLLLISLGHVSSLGSPLAGPLISLINGPASPFRNLWKFDPMIRLPLALGLAHLLAVARSPQSRVPGRQAALAAAAAAAFAGLAVPAFVTGLASAGSFGQVPSYWVSAAGWLTAHAENQAVLVEPGAPFGQYLWGSPMDDVLQALTNVDYAERNLSVVGSAGNERLLNSIDQRLAAGDGSAGLTEVLARMGVKYVVVRNDLALQNRTWPARVNQALAASPGMTKVAQFGQFVGYFAPDDATTNFLAPYPPVEIFQVAGAQPEATVAPAAGAVRVYGGPESLLTLADENLLGNRPVLLNGDGAGQPAAGSVVTDSLRRRVRNFGEINSSYSPTLTGTQPALTFDATDDYTEPGWDTYQAVAEYTGIKNVTASSSASDIQAIPSQWASGLLPFAAVDGDMRTRWESGSWTGPVGQWIQEDFDAPVDPGTISVAFDDSSSLGPPVAQVLVSTAAGQVADPVAATSAAQPLRVPDGASSWLRITVTGLSSQPRPAIGTQAGIYDISVPGVRAGRTIVAPSVPGGDPSAVMLAKDEPPPSGCMLTSLRWVCSPQLTAPAEEQFGFDHSFTEPAPEPATLRGSAILIDPALADRFVRLSPRQARVTASSTYTGDPQDQALSAFDGNPATAWVASVTDAHPALSIQWGYQRTVSKLTIQRPPGAAGLLQVLISGSGGQVRGALLGDSGAVRFAPMRTTGLKFSFSQVQAPLQITDVTIPGVPPVGVPSGTFRLKCGLGPLIKLNGQVVRTRVSGSFASLLTGRPLRFTACSPVSLSGGGNRVAEPATDAFSVQDVVVDAGLPAALPAAPTAAVVVSWTSTSRVLRVSAATASYLVVNENFNAGWRAVTGHGHLRAVRLDGWKQAWVLPGGTSGLVHLTYQPEQLYHPVVAGGLAAVVLVMLVAVWPWPLPLPRRSRLARQGWLARQAREARALGGRRLARRAASAMVLGALVITGFLLGGYAGAVIVPAATCLFLVSNADLPTLAEGGETLGRLWRPRVLAGLLIAASVCGAAGEHLQQAGTSGLAVTALLDGIPQVICLVIVGRLAAAVILALPGRNRPAEEATLRS
jgi:arabinofuranan 3-O-arabinosyltransferase